MRISGGGHGQRGTKWPAESEGATATGRQRQDDSDRTTATRPLSGDDCRRRQGATVKPATPEGQTDWSAGDLSRVTQPKARETWEKALAFMTFFQTDPPWRHPRGRGRMPENSPGRDGQSRHLGIWADWEWWVIRCR